jgi:hypothetical protein
VSAPHAIAATPASLRTAASQTSDDLEKTSRATLDSNQWPSASETKAGT